MADMRPLAVITEATGLGMVLIRADLARAGDAIAEAAGLPVPDVTRFTADAGRWLGWMAPDELLLVLPGADLTATLAALTDALATEHALVQDVSDMRCVFDLAGRKPAQVLAKLCPVDPNALPADGLRRTRAAQVACALWRREGSGGHGNAAGEVWRIVAFRSVRDYLAGILATAAAPGTDLDPR
ncbi:sarcosine oxidase subunit gamma [uncultured Paracoccus sp.]|uniref:sarcosine oxidase subunit gamma n=1 Tax=uncultured Paracoccus sp. TaxID=189685 RepID=UPI0026224BEA|nr:sarcosine oxidase subunit gamma family protein [uncultured Paracoccus sp.]